MLRDVRLDEQRCHARIQARGKPIDQDVPDVLLQSRGVVVARGEHVPVSHEEKAFVLVLEVDPVSQCAMIVPQMEAAGRAHAGEHAPGRGVRAHACPWEARVCRTVKG